MKKITSFSIFFVVLSTYAQQYNTPPGLEKFVGTWRYINGQDTITLKSTAGFAAGGEIYLKGLYFYYNYTTGANSISNNLINFGISIKADFVGTKPYGGVNLDTLKFQGRDKLKRKDDEGYLMINAANNQIIFKRDIGIFGGGMSFYKPGEEPLPGYILPAVFTLNKVVIPPPIPE